MCRQTAFFLNTSILRICSWQGVGVREKIQQWLAEKLLSFIENLPEVLDTLVEVMATSCHQVKDSK